MSYKKNIETIILEETQNLLLERRLYSLIEQEAAKLGVSLTEARLKKIIREEVEWTVDEREKDEKAYEKVVDDVFDQLESPLKEAANEDFEELKAYREHVKKKRGGYRKFAALLLALNIGLGPVIHNRLEAEDVGIPDRLEQSYAVQDFKNFKKIQMQRHGEAAPELSQEEARELYDSYSGKVINPRASTLDKVDEALVSNMSAQTQAIPKELRQAGRPAHVTTVLSWIDPGAISDTDLLPDKEVSAGAYKKSLEREFELAPTMDAKIGAAVKMMNDLLVVRTGTTGQSAYWLDHQPIQELSWSVKYSVLKDKITDGTLDQEKLTDAIKHFQAERAKGKVVDVSSLYGQKKKK